MPNNSDGSGKRNTANDDKIMETAYEQLKSCRFTRRNYYAVMEEAGFMFDEFAYAFDRLYERKVIVKAGEMGLAWVYRLKQRRKTVGKEKTDKQ